jgi:hypothetical protein
MATTNGPICIEVVDDAMVAVLKSRTPVERLEMAAGMWRSARDLIQATVQQGHPDWDAEHVQREVARRLSHGVV